jgi:hypothetical protein
MANDSEKKDAGQSRPEPAARQRASRDPQVFVLLRELSEVHLLLDNVSANPTSTVSERSSVKRPKELKADWIEEVCQISWPPDGSSDEKAEDAALLIRAKDHLNRLSHPASGASIAFTLLVTQGGGRKGWLRRRLIGNEISPTRNTLAQAAYPDLVAKAATFRTWMMWICGGLVAALVLTCAISWYVAYGNAALAELATARETLAEAQTRVNSAETADWTQAADANQDGGGPAAEDAAQPAPGTGAAPAAATQRPFSPYCGAQPYENPTQSQLCVARQRAETSQLAVERRLANWLCWDWVRDCASDPKVRDAPSRAAAFANILGSAVLPFLYGLLGAGAAIIRSLSRKIRESRLSPRDLVLSFQQLALGAVVGACIGLFVVAPGADETGESLLGPVALSASAISFVAGFGVESVFQALEALITRIFNISPAPPAGGGGRAGGGGGGSGSGAPPGN